MRQEEKNKNVYGRNLPTAETAPEKALERDREEKTEDREDPTAHLNDHSHAKGNPRPPRHAEESDEEPS